MNKQKYFILLFCIALFCALIYPRYFQTLFVKPSGYFGSPDELSAFLIAAGVFTGWKAMRRLFIYIFAAIILFELFVLINITGEFFMNFLILIIIHTALLIVFLYSKTVKENFSRS